MIESYLLKLERDLVGGVLHVMLLTQIDRSGPIHGYGVIKALTESAGGRPLFKEGTIYPILNELERVGVVRSEWGHGSAGPQRKYYSLTPLGRQTLKIAQQEWVRVRVTMDTILNGNGKRSGTK